jgi:hypothetical protein
MKSIACSGNAIWLVLLPKNIRFQRNKQKKYLNKSAHYSLIKINILAIGLQKSISHRGLNVL